MGTNKLKKVTSLFISLILTLSVFTINTSANYEFNDPRESATQVNQILSDNQRQAWELIKVDDQSSGLVGFEDINLDTDEMISVIVEFVNLPAPVAMARDMATNRSVSTYSSGYYEVLAAADRVIFQEGLDNLFGNQFGIMSVSSNKQYEIGWEYSVGINGLEIRLPANKAAELLSISSVSAIYPNSVVTQEPITFDAAGAGETIYGADAYGMNDTRTFLGVNDLHAEGIKGKNVIVGVIDSGVDYNHPDIKDAFLDYVPNKDKTGGEMLPIKINGVEKYRFLGWDFVTVNTFDFAPIPPRASKNDPMESTYTEWVSQQPKYPASNGRDTFYTYHGTHVTGEIIGRGVATNTADGFLPQLGIAPEANVISYRAMGPYGSGLTSDILKAIEQTALDGCDVVNMSLGNSSENGPYYITSRTINNIILTYDIVFCIAAGNSYSSLTNDTSFIIGSPGTASMAITVGALEIKKAPPVDEPIKIQLLTDSKSTNAYVWFLDSSGNFVEIPGKSGLHMSDYSGLQEPDQDGKFEFVMVSVDKESDPNFALFTQEDAGKIAVAWLPSGRGDIPDSYSKNARAAGAGGLVVLFGNSMYTEDVIDDNIDIFTLRTKGSQYVPTFAIANDLADIFLAELENDGWKASFRVATGEATHIVTYFSSRGPVTEVYDIKPDIIAPGYVVYSTFPYYISNPNNPDDYSKAYSSISGTSMACPQAAGLVALMLGQNIKANENNGNYGRDSNGQTLMKPAEVKARLMNTADSQSMATGYGVNDIGSGRTHISKAIFADTYITVKKDNVICLNEDEKIGYTASFSFGLANLGESKDISLDAIINNLSAAGKTFSVEFVPNTSGQPGTVVKYDSNVTLSVSGAAVNNNKITVSSNGKAEFSITVHVPDTLINEGSYEGYVILTNDLKPSETYRLPYSVFVSATGKFITDFYVDKPLITSGPVYAQTLHPQSYYISSDYLNGGNINSMVSSVYLTLGRPGQSFLNLYISKAEGFNENNPSYLGYAYQWDSISTKGVEPGSYVLNGLLCGFYNLDPVPGKNGTFYDDYTPLDTGHYILTMEVQDYSGNIERNFAHFYVANEAPELKVTTVNASTITGTVYDVATSYMMDKDIFNRDDGTRFDYENTVGVFACVTQGGQYYWSEAEVSNDGSFKIDLTEFRLDTVGRDGAITNPEINFGTEITLCALNGFVYYNDRFLHFVDGSSKGFCIEGFSPLYASFMGPQKGTLSDREGVIATIHSAYNAVNVANYTITLNGNSTINLTAYGEIALTSGESATLFPELNDMAKLAGDVTWSSSNNAVATVNQNGVVTAGNTVGTAIVTASVNGASDSATITVVAPAPASTVSAGVSLNEGDYVYYGALAHPTSLSGGVAGSVSNRETENTPVLWRVMGEEKLQSGSTDGYLTLMSRYVLGSSMFNEKNMEAHYKGSRLQAYLNGEFLKTFSSSEEDNIPSITVTTGFYTNPLIYGRGYDLHVFNPVNYEAYNQKVYIPWGKAGTESSPGGSGSHIYWSANGVYEGNELPNDLNVRKTVVKGGNLNTTSNYGPKIYWVRNRTEYPSQPMADAVGGNGLFTYGYTPYTILGIRPITKLIPESIVFAHEITNDGTVQGAIAPDPVYYVLPTDFEAGAGKVYKLTVLGKGNGASVGTHDFEYNVYGDVIDINNLSTSQYGPDYVLAYKIVDKSDNIVSYGELGTSATVQNLRINLAAGVLVEGDTYCLYTWLQKNSRINSNEAGLIQEHEFIATKAERPEIDDVQPEITDVNVDVNGNIIITFDMQMAVEGNVYLRKESGQYGSALYDGSFNQDGTVYTIPYYNLDYSTKYFIKIEGFGSAATRPQFIETSVDEYYFTTRTQQDTIPPSVLSVTPSGTNVVVSTSSITITFNKRMDTSVQGLVTLTGGPASVSTHTWRDDYTVEYVLSGLNHNTVYTVNISEFKDVSGNMMTADNTHTFTTEAAAPIAFIVSPADGLTNVALSGIIVVNFDQPMDITQGTITISDGLLGTGTWSEDRRTYSVPYSEWDYYYDSDYSITVNDDFYSIYGKRLAATVSSTVRTLTKPDSPSISPYGSVVIYEGDSFPVYVNFGDPSNNVTEALINVTSGYGCANVSATVINTDGDSFIVQGISAGDAVITVTFDDYDTTVETIYVTVNPLPFYTYNIYVETDGNGTAEANPSMNVPVNTEVTLSASATATGYEFDEWVPSGNLRFPAINETSPVTAFNMPPADVGVKATFRQVDYQITVNSNNGTVTVNGTNTPVTAQYNEFVTLSATPASGYHFVEWQVVSGNVTLNTYTGTPASFMMPAGPVEITAVFAQNEYKVNVITNGNGTATALPSTASPGTSVVINAVHNEGYHFAGWQVISGGVVLDTYTGTTATFIMSAGNVTVMALFEADQPVQPTYYTVQVAQMAGGTAYASKTSAAEGESVTLTATPGIDYIFKGWNVISGNVTLANTSVVTFVMPAANVRVAPMFEYSPGSVQTSYTVTVNVSGSGTAYANYSTAQEGTLVTLTATPAAGWHFVKWDVVNGFINITNNSFYMPASNIILAAIFEEDVITPVQHTVNFWIDGLIYTTRTVANGASLGAGWPTEPYRNNYTFSAWVDSLNNVYYANTAIRSDVDLYATWRYNNPDQKNDPPIIPDPTPSQSVSQSQQPSPAQNVLVSSAVDVNYTKSGDNVNLTLPSNKISEIIAKSTGKVSFDLQKTTGATTVTLPREAMRSVSNAGLNLEISLPVGVVTFSPSAMSNIVANTGGADITVVARLAESTNLTSAQKAVVGGRQVYELAVYDGDKAITNFDGSVEISLPYDLKPGEDQNSIIIYFVDANGNLQIVPNCRYENGRVIFTTTHFSIYMIAYNPVSFSDIGGHWAYDAIKQSGARQLVSGYTDGAFKPDAYVTRAEFIQLLYNALRLKDVNQSDYSMYNDVTADMWFYTAIAAAKQAGLLNGIAYSDGTFKPNEPITRQEMADVLAKLATAKKAKVVKDIKVAIFSDCAEISIYSLRAVELAINVGFLNENGMGDGTFGPGEYVTRAQAAAIQMTVVQVLGKLN